jgi:threonine dehydrogenase-like Zn-dependent dehydrogenase
MDPERDVVFGHEFCGEVVDHGAGTDKRLKPGTLVCSMPMTIAGNTVHGIGYSNDIAGGFAQYMPLAERLLLEVPNVFRRLTPHSLSPLQWAGTPSRRRG